MNAAIAKARQLNVNVSVAVCDEYGHLIALKRMDGAYAEVNRFSIGKAVVSAGTGLPSGDGEVSSIIRRPLTLLGTEGLGYGFGADCRSSEAAGSRAPAASTEHYPASKMKSAHAPGLPAS